MFLKSKKNADVQNGPWRMINSCFALNLPEDWQDQSIYRFVGPEEDGVQHNIMITVEHNVAQEDLQRYAAVNIHAVEQTLQGYHELKRGDLLLDSGRPAFEIVYRWTPVDDRTIFQRVIYYLEGTTGYVLTASFSKKTWKTMGAQVDAILRSFQGPETTCNFKMTV